MILTPLRFLYLKLITLIETYDDQMDLTISARLLEIGKYDIYQNFSFNFDRSLEQQSNFLIHLIIDVDSYERRTHQYKYIDATSISQHIRSLITHLYLFIDKQNSHMTIYFKQFSYCLIHLTLHFFEEYLIDLHVLIPSTLQATDNNDLINDK
ncbi:unnamed protein product [Adineta steineri]|uniref:Uncharacterized protein n=1 Tax=Adineta steineri TaxID=433720 RepID=A0A818L9N4_9BILA|nr:unnamed protein product [Adineta steineri]